MKRKLQIIILTLITTACIFSFIQPKKLGTKTPKEVLNYFLYNGLLQERLIDEPKTWMGDSTIYITQNRSTYSVNIAPKTYCGNSPAYFSSDISAAIVVIDTINNEEKYVELPESFKRIYGKNLLKKAPTELKNFRNIFYDGTALQEAFNKTYIKPTTNIDGFIMQKVYDISVKEFARVCTKVMIDVLQNKSKFNQQVIAYKSLKQQHYYSGINFCYEAGDKILGEDYIAKKLTPKEASCITEKSSRIVGMMMRRQIDGSLPVILNCIKTVLKDYDPSYYNEVKNKLVL